MPVVRYFAYTGSVLLALLFLLDWYLPSPALEPARTDIDRSIIRLHSRVKWPSAVAFDTSQPAILPPSVEAPPARSPLEALAMVRPTEQPSPVVATAPQAVPKRVVRRAKPARTPAPQIAGGYDMFGFRNPFPDRW